MRRLAGIFSGLAGNQAPLAGRRVEQRRRGPQDIRERELRRRRDVALPEMRRGNSTRIRSHGSPSARSGLERLPSDSSDLGAQNKVSRTRRGSNRGAVGVSREGSNDHEFREGGVGAVEIVFPDRRVEEIGHFPKTGIGIQTASSSILERVAFLTCPFVTDIEKCQPSPLTRSTNCLRKQALSTAIQTEAFAGINGSASFLSCFLQSPAESLSQLIKRDETCNGPMNAACNHSARSPVYMGSAPLKCLP